MLLPPLNDKHCPNKSSYLALKDEIDFGNWEHIFSDTNWEVFKKDNMHNIDIWNRYIQNIEPETDVRNRSVTGY